MFVYFAHLMQRFNLLESRHLVTNVGTVTDITSTTHLFKGLCHKTDDHINIAMLIIHIQTYLHHVTCCSISLASSRVTSLENVRYSNFQSFLIHTVVRRILVTKKCYVSFTNMTLIEAIKI